MKINYFQNNFGNPSNLTSLHLESFYKDHSVTGYHKNLQDLNTEIFKDKNNLAPDVIKDVFGLNEPPYNLRSESNHFTRLDIGSTR